jgi:hypothetical protein
MTVLLGEGGVILRSAFAGPSYQYSHGLSVFFPWAQPGNDAFWPTEYRGYKFEEAGWRDFLQRYFENTMREPRRDEPGHGHPERPDEVVSDVKPVGEGGDGLNEQLLEGITAHIFERGEPGQLSKGGGSDAMGKGGGSDATGKGGGSDASGDGCDCPPIKNYPSFTRRPRRKEKGADESGDRAAYQGPTYLILPQD